MLQRGQGSLRLPVTTTDRGSFSHGRESPRTYYDPAKKSCTKALEKGTVKKADFLSPEESLASPRKQSRERPAQPGGQSGAASPEPARGHSPCTAETLLVLRSQRDCGCVRMVPTQQLGAQTSGNNVNAGQSLGKSARGSGEGSRRTGGAHGCGGRTASLSKHGNSTRRRGAWSPDS